MKETPGRDLCVLCVQSLSPVQLFAASWNVARQHPLSMKFSGQEYWSGLPFPTPGNLPDPGIEPVSPEAPALAGRFFTTESPGSPWRDLVVINSSSKLKHHLMSRSRTDIDSQTTHVTASLWFRFSVPWTWTKRDWNRPEDPLGSRWYSHYGSLIAC